MNRVRQIKGEPVRERERQREKQRERGRRTLRQRTAVGARASLATNWGTPMEADRRSRTTGHTCRSRNLWAEKGGVSLGWAWEGLSVVWASGRRALATGNIPIFLSTKMLTLSK